MNEAEQMELMSLCKMFLEGQREVDDLPQDTMKAVRESFKQMRNVYQVGKSLQPRNPGNDRKAATEAFPLGQLQPSSTLAEAIEPGLIGESPLGFH